MELRAAFLGANVVEIVDIEAFVHADAFKVFVFIIETMKYVEGNGLNWTYLAYDMLHIVLSAPSPTLFRYEIIKGVPLKLGYAFSI